LAHDVALQVLCSRDQWRLATEILDKFIHPEGAMHIPALELAASSISKAIVEE